MMYSMEGPLDLANRLLHMARYSAFLIVFIADLMVISQKTVVQ
jgi:hypothetical protein